VPASGAPPSPLGGTEVHDLHSAIVDDTFRVFVGHCGTDGVDNASVLYLVDANGMFGAVVDAIRLMQLSQFLPPMLVIGIGYRTGTLGDAAVRRTRDLTPTPWPGYVRFAPHDPPRGGAPQFLAFIRDELSPWVTDRFGTAVNGATFFGHSLGGLFASYILLNATEAFANYIIGSPSLWWDERVLFDQEVAYAATHDDLRARVFFGIGSLETNEGRALEASRLDEEARRLASAAYLDMVDDLQQFVDRLGSRAYPSLRMHHEVYTDEFHVTVPFLILSRGLRRLFDAPG
jgi:predicted alpha/beta superfamily hydrolase